MSEFTLNIQKRINRERPEINLQDEYTEFYTQINKKKEMIKDHPTFKEQQQMAQGKPLSLKSKLQEGSPMLRREMKNVTPTHVAS